MNNETIDINFDNLKGRQIHMILFKKCYIEITNVCNLNCDFCPQTRRKQEFMSIETFGRILDQIKPYTDYIYLHVKGEPLLHPKIEEFLDLSNEKGFKVNITTNGTMINMVKNKLILKPALRQINFSLHSIDGNVGYQGKEDYIDSILSFVKEARDKSELLVSLRLWNLEEKNVANFEICGNTEIFESANSENCRNPEKLESANSENCRNLEILEATNLEKCRNKEILERIQKEFNLPYKIQEEIVPGRGIKLADGIYLNQDHKFDWPDLAAQEDDGVGFCYGLRNQIAILVDGTVVPCCLDGEGVINLGNINTTHFAEIINNERSSNIIEGFSRREAVEELCRKCGYRKRFGKK